MLWGKGEKTNKEATNLRSLWGRDKTERKRKKIYVIIWRNDGNFRYKIIIIIGLR